ncbi:unnamed protein product [Oikopleura dioica]|uniref:Uncharacterized protein n=1 Tax=Oikopleura dioica TaxID=34765 RepID=E4YZ80_OIKDI|nr:unnamed protein product [Oikopleura dioica]
MKTRPRNSVRLVGFWPPRAVEQYLSSKPPCSYSSVAADCSPKCSPCQSPVISTPSTIGSIRRSITPDYSSRSSSRSSRSSFSSRGRSYSRSSSYSRGRSYSSSSSSRSRSYSSGSSRSSMSSSRSRSRSRSNSSRRSNSYSRRSRSRSHSSSRSRSRSSSSSARSRSRSRSYSRSRSRTRSRYRTRSRSDPISDRFSAKYFQAIPDRRAAPRGTRITVATENEDASGRSRLDLNLFSYRLFKAKDQSKTKNTSYSQNSKSVFPKYPCLRHAISRLVLLLSFLTLQKSLESSSTYQLSCWLCYFVQFVTKPVKMCALEKFNKISIHFILI